MLRRAFTLVEILVVLAIIMLLAALIFPVFSRARESARRSSCMSNQRQIVAAMQMYVQDNSRLPNQDQLARNGMDNLNHSLYHPYAKSHEIFFCPENMVSGAYYSRLAPNATSLLPGALTVVSFCLQHTKVKNSLDYFRDAENIRYCDETYVIARWDGSAKVIPGSQTRDWLYINGKWKPREIVFADPKPDALEETRFPGEEWPLQFS